MKEKVSIIVPIYNSSKTLDRCIKSLLAQSYDNIEIILVNDGSKDSSCSICESYKKDNSNIILKNKENGGVSSARNLGIQTASGSNIIFVDSDDYVEPDFVANFINGGGNSELVIQGFYVEQNNQNVTSVFMPTMEYDKAWEVVKYLEETPNVHNGYLWHRMFKAYIIKENNIFFKEGVNFAEDGLFFLEYLRFVSSTTFVSSMGYHYVLSDGFLTKKGNSYSPVFFQKLFSDYKRGLTNVVKDIDKNPIYKKLVDDYLFRLLEYWFVRKIFIQKSMNSKADWLGVTRQVIQDNDFLSVKYPFYKKLMISGGLIQNPKIAEDVLKISTKILSLVRKLQKY